jgi:acyl-CoA synthetase (AMP-forming)/AMP-acid ligase II
VPEAAAPAAGRVAASDVALLVYTSGSTGTPRAVVQTHGNVDANSRAIAAYLELTARDRAMATLPLFYCYGRSVLQTHLLVGGSVFFDHRFMYPKVVLDEMVAQGCTGFAGVPLTFENLKRQVDVAALDLTPLRYVTQAGGRMHPDTVAWVRAAFAPAELFVMYGQTEATARLTYLPPAMADTKAGSVGVAVAGVELGIVDDAGAPVATGTAGNVVARGASITPGYFHAPEETAEILRDGWLWTGDIGRLDGDGYLFLTGRTKDFMKLGGNRVAPQEIEDVLARHPAVQAVAVGGGSDSTGAEQAVAFVVPRVGAVVDENDVRRFCREHLPAFKVPTRVVTVDALPLTSSNKIARTTIQEWIRNDPSLLP